MLFLMQPQNYCSLMYGAGADVGSTYSGIKDPVKGLEWGKWWWEQVLVCYLQNLLL